MHASPHGHQTILTTFFPHLPPPPLLSHPHLRRAPRSTPRCLISNSVQKCQAPWIEQLKEKLAGAVKHWSDQCGNASEVVVKVAAGTLELTFKDCGVNAYAKVLTVAPNVLPLGKTTTISGTGQLSKDVAAASFDIQTTGITGSLGHCTSADASKPLTCALKVAGLPVGTMAYHGIPFPIKTGPLTGIPQLDITLPASLPSFASATTTTLKVTAANGDQVMCVQVFTKASSTATDTMKALRGAPTQIA